MCKECGCESPTVACEKCGGRMVIVDGQAVCTACNAVGDAHALAHLRGEHHHHEHDEHEHEHIHAHEHEHEHTHVHEHSHTSSAPDELTRLCVLLPHWLEQNHDRLREVRTWAAMARALGQSEAGALMEAALKQLEAGDRQLAAAVAALAH